MSTSRFRFDGPMSRLEHEPAPMPYVEGSGWVARVGYVFAALLLVAALLASFNPKFGFHNAMAGNFNARLWPWELFDSEHHLGWTRETAWVITMSGAALVLLACAFVRSRRIRARLALVTTVIVGALLLPPAEREADLVTACGLNLLLAALMAASIGIGSPLRRSSALRLAAMATVALAVLLFLPVPPVLNEVGDPSPGYISIGKETIGAFANALGPDPLLVGRMPSSEEFPGGKPIYATVWNLAPVFAQHLAWLFGLLVGVLVTLRLGRGWARFAMGLVVLVAIVGPSVVFGWRTVDEERRKLTEDQPFGTQDLVLYAARGASDPLLRLERLILLPLALGLADLLRSARRRT